MLIEIEAGKKDVEGHMAEIAAREKAVEDGLILLWRQRRKPASHKKEARASDTNDTADIIKVNFSGTHIDMLRGTVS